MTAERVSEGIARVLEYIIAAMLVVITLLVFINVLTRYVFLYSIIWSEEVARFTFIWLIFIGTAVAIKRGAHFHITLIELRDGSLAKQVTRVVSTVAVAVLPIVLLTQGITLVESTMRQSSPNIGIPMGLAYLSIPLSGALILVFLGLDLLSYLSRRGLQERTGSDSTPASVAER